MPSKIPPASCSLSKRKKRGQNPPTTNALLHTVNEFAERARVSRVTVYRMINSGELRSVLLLNSRRIPVTEYTRLGLTGDPDKAA